MRLSRLTDLELDSNYVGFEGIKHLVLSTMHLLSVFHLVINAGDAELMAHFAIASRHLPSLSMDTFGDAALDGVVAAPQYMPSLTCLKVETVSTGGLAPI
jgi:hypothetical protein